MQLRDYQEEIDASVKELIERIANCCPLVVSGTGTGKTEMMAWRTREYAATHYQAAIAHRRELISQIALAYARRGIPHRIVGPDATVRQCRAVQLDELGRCLIDQSATVGVCSVDTLAARDLEGDLWARSVTIAHWDEAHHVLRDNKWGRALAKFPNLKHSIGYTATPRRADRKGLGATSAGIFTHMVEGPPMWQMMANAYLTPYKLITGNVTDLDLSRVGLGSDGDYNPQALRTAVKASRKIVGDAVKIYRRYCDGSKAVLFACDVEDATRYRDRFCAEGIPAAIVTADTKDDIRRDTMKRFKRGEIKVLVNVDLFGEGFDLPAITTVIMCRPTKSLPLYQQQFGRALRLMVEKHLMKLWHTFTPAERHAHIAASEKPFAFIIDLVRNWAQPECGGLPDARGRVWSLEGAAKSGAGGPTDVPQTRSCLNPHHLPIWNALGPDAQRVLNGLGRAAVDTSSDEGAELCTGVYERFLTACPFCNWEPIPAKRTIEQVDGDVGLVDEETLARLRGEIREANTTPSLGGKWAAKHYKDHAERFRALQDLSQTLTWWGPAYELEQGRKLSDREQAKAFYLTFGVDVYTAQALKRADAAALRQKILDWFELKQITIAA